jgi:DNA (cytosine-5)-methyltransferase 1
MTDRPEIIAVTLREAGITDYCSQVCGGGQCGTGPLCLYGIDPNTRMPPEPQPDVARDGVK